MGLTCSQLGQHKVNEMCRNVKNFIDGFQQEFQLLYVVRDLCFLFLNLFVSVRSCFVDEAKRRGVVKKQESKAAIQRDMARLEKCADRNLEILNKSEPSSLGSPVQEVHLI